MSNVVRKTCPVTLSDIIVITYPDPKEQVLTQRKNSEGKYEKVLRPQKEVKHGLIPRISCPSLGHPAIHAPHTLGKELWEKGISWCKKTKKECPMEQILKDLDSS